MKKDDFFENFSKFLKTSKMIQEKHKKSLYPEAKKHGISMVEAEILLFFAKNPEFKFAKDAVKHRAFSKALLSISIEKLRNKGLIVFSEFDEDKRHKSISITEKGGLLAKKLDVIQTEFISKIRRILNNREKRALLNILDKLIKGMESSDF